MIIAVDFDGTLCDDCYPAIGPAHLDIIRQLQTLHQNGCRLILWTCRNQDALTQAVAWCQKYGLTFDAVNENLPEVINQYHGHDSRKITYDYLIDDRNLTPNTFLKIAHQLSTQT